MTSYGLKILSIWWSLTIFISHSLCKYVVISIYLIRCCCYCCFYFSFLINNVIVYVSSQSSSVQDVWVCAWNKTVLGNKIAVDKAKSYRKAEQRICFKITPEIICLSGIKGLLWPMKIAFTSAIKGDLYKRAKSYPFYASGRRYFFGQAEGIFLDELNAVCIGKIKAIFID